MSDPFIAEIRIFSFVFAPRGWAMCDGMELQAAQNAALYSILGNKYGGGDNKTFMLPNLQGRVPIGAGRGPGLSFRGIGESGGEQAVQLNKAELPQHTHALKASSAAATTTVPENHVLARASGNAYVPHPDSFVHFFDQALMTAGSPNNEPHDNIQPSLPLHYCIALAGIYPPRQ